MTMRITPFYLGIVCTLFGVLAMSAVPVRAAPIAPTQDDEVIEVLPAARGGRTEERRLRVLLAQQPRDPALALGIATRYLAQAHEFGDPRFAGMAMSALEGWMDDATMPEGVLMMRATLQQYLHEFDASVRSLQVLLTRPSAQPRPQAWLTLATVKRVQGRYADSDAACKQVAASGAGLHADACLAENAALRGDVARARAAFNALLASAGNTVSTQAWLTTSLAELEQRAGRAGAADAAYRAALKLEPDPYTTLSYADLLIEQQRPAEALALLKTLPRSDAVLLRLAIAGTQGKRASAAADAAEMRERIALANERPDAKLFHGREQAMFALWVDRQPERALELARGNVVRQREPIDLLVLAQAARASGREEALQEAKRLMTQMGLRDQRTQALLGNG
jgi:hypothetical protein